jgi:hypothetical protein
VKNVTKPKQPGIMHEIRRAKLEQANEKESLLRNKDWKMLRNELIVHVTVWIEQRQVSQVPESDIRGAKHLWKNNRRFSQSGRKNQQSD